MTTENTKEAPASTRHLDTLYHETFNSSLGETGEYEGHSIIRTETGGDWYADLCDPSDEAVEGHKEIVRRVNGYPELLKQLSHKEREVERLRAVLSNAKGWIIANTSKPVHDLIRLIDSALEAKSIQPPEADASRVVCKLCNGLGRVYNKESECPEQCICNDPMIDKMGVRDWADKECGFTEARPKQPEDLMGRTATLTSLVKTATPGQSNICVTTGKITLCTDDWLEITTDTGSRCGGPYPKSESGSWFIHPQASREVQG